MTRLKNDTDDPIVIDPGEEVRFSDEEAPDFESSVEELRGMSKRYTLIRVTGRADG